MAYTFDNGENPVWQLYTENLRIPSGHWTLRAKAIRIGYQESEESRIQVSSEE